jgi:3',5'-cyclic-AMP phosphodiesterase
MEAAMATENGDRNQASYDRRGFLQCMAWAGTAALWTLAGGELKGMAIEHTARRTTPATAGGLRFA